VGVGVGGGGVGVGVGAIGIELGGTNTTHVSGSGMIGAATIVTGSCVLAPGVVVSAAGSSDS
jgi:hypothetical protein